MNNINQKIPEGWSVKKLGEISQVITGSTPQTLDVTNYGKEFLFVSPADINDNVKYITDTTTKLSSKGFSLCRIIKKGSPMFVCIGSTIGKTALAGIDLATNQQINSCIVKNCINNEFLYYNLSFQSNKIRLLAGEQAVPIINKSTFEKIKLSIPPLAEQEKIALVLGTWDEAIEKLSNLIEQKKLLKKGLMQKLLTGKTRLSGFTQPWKEVKLGKIAEFVKGKQLNKLDMVETGIYPVLNGGITYSGYTDDWNTEKDTITVSEGGNSCGYINYVKEKFWCGGHCYVVNNIKENKLFLYHLLKFNEQDIMKLRVGSGLPNIQVSSLNKFKIYIPSDTSEQQAIADVLSTADDEINLLNQKLEAL